MSAKNKNLSYLRDHIPLHVKRVGDILISNGYEAYLVGGSVRDLLLVNTPKDFDIATNAYPEEIQELFQRTIATGAKFGTIVVIMDDDHGERYNVEVTTYRSESDYYGGRWPAKVEFAKRIEDDLKRRDFTINALAVNLDLLNKTDAILDEVLVDLFNGVEDLESKLIRAVGDAKERFQEDGLRPVRACRLASQLGFKIESDTFASISSMLSVVQNISIERFRDEFSKLIYGSAKPSYGINLLKDSGILKLFIPELIECIGVTQPEFHTDDVYTHLLKTLDLAQDEIKLAALFHDIGKPRTLSKDEAGSHFFQHDIVSAEMTEEILRRLRYSNKDIEHTVTLVRYHMFYYPSADWRKAQVDNIHQYVFTEKDLEKLENDEQNRTIGGWSDAAIRRFISKVGGVDNINDLIKLRIADATANPKSTFTPVEIEALQRRISKIFEEDAALKIQDLNITGHDLMEIGVEKGPKIGEILTKLLDDVIEDPSLNTKGTLLQRATKYL